ncbi:hypothetical protein [Ferrimicrobium sp.]|uniref:hypothetical protein n=1 Tax=Ferrimicrobium sp. TaxID=2926050 RepID=UPI002625046B|nr:hypothetical protein [Ferrimicrobium sp.]
MDYGKVHLDIIGFVVGILLTELALVLYAVSHATLPSRVTSSLQAIGLWIGSFLLMLVPLQLLLNPSLHSHAKLWWFFGGAACLTSLSAVQMFVVGDPPLVPRTQTRLSQLILLSTWVTWGVLATALLAGIYRYLPVLSMVIAAIVVLGVVLAVVSYVRDLDHRLLMRLPVGLTIFLLLVGLGAAFVDHSSTLQLELGANQRPILATVTQGSPGVLNIQHLNAGLLTSGLGQSDRVLQLDFHGYLRVTKPNFHQLVTLTIHGRFGDSKTQSLLFRARGVPQPGGALDVVSSSLTLRSRSPRLTARGRANAVLSDAVFGTLQLHHRHYTYLLTYEPTGLYVLTGSISFWPQSPGLGHAALE